MKKSVFCRFLALVVMVTMVFSLLPNVEVRASEESRQTVGTPETVEVSEETYRAAKFITEDRYVVQKATGYGIVDFEGNELVECIYDGYKRVGVDEIEFYDGVVATVYNVNSLEEVITYSTWEAVEYQVLDEWVEDNRSYSLTTADKDWDDVCDLYREYWNGLLCEMVFVRIISTYTGGSSGGMSEFYHWKVTYTDVASENIIYTGLTDYAGIDETFFSHAFSFDLSEASAVVLDYDGKIVVIDDKVAVTYERPASLGGYFHWGAYGDDNWIRFFEMGIVILYNPVTEEIIFNNNVEYWAASYYYGYGEWYAVADEYETELYDIYYRDELIVDNCLGALFYEDYFAYGNSDDDCVYMDYSGNVQMITDQHAEFVDGMAMVYYEERFCIINEEFDILYDELPLSEYRPYNTGVVKDEYGDCHLVRISMNTENPFRDVYDDTYYYEPVLWAYENNITAGLTETEFGTEQSCTRAQIVTFLWRAAGKPSATGNVNPFADVPADEYYTQAVLWAVENNITAGLTETQFGPDEVCTRAQIVTFLWRVAGKPVATNMTNPFADVPANEFYAQAVLWAVENNVTAGLTATKFGPNEPCTRAQVVTFLYRVYNN